MAWPFGSSKGSGEVEADLTEERLRMMANITIEQVPMPEEGILSEEDAWTISPGPSRVRMDTGGGQDAPVAVQAAPVTANLDTSALERLISNRLDMVEDVLRGLEHRAASGAVSSRGEDGEVVGDAGGDGISFSSGGNAGAGAIGSDRLMGEDAAPLLELYEAQALESNPFLRAPHEFGDGSGFGVGAPTVAALLLDHLSGMATVSFVEKAIASGMLNADEGKEVLAIVQLAAPGETEDALDDHLPNKELLTFSAFVSTWRKSKRLMNGVE
jgi:hypothetical protein